jgi:hypothetical protein
MVVIVLLQRIGTGRGRAEFPMQVQGFRPKPVHQDRHASGRAMVAAAAYMALIARHLRILAVRSSIPALQLACYTRRHGPDFRSSKFHHLQEFTTVFYREDDAIHHVSACVSLQAFFEGLGSPECSFMQGLTRLPLT